LGIAMDVLVVDLTHGGVKIAVEMEKLGDFDNIWGYDIYNTLKKDDKQLLKSYNIKVLDSYNKVDSYNKELSNSITDNEFLLFENFLNNLDSKELLIINPVHSPFNLYSLFNLDSNIVYNSDFNINYSYNGLNIKEITHHEAVKLILKNWKEKTKIEDIPIIEVTGVKGKTSVVAMLKEIMIAKNPLVLSSLGAFYYKDNKKISLKKNISITPASILETIDLAKNNNNSKNNSSNNNSKNNSSNNNSKNNDNSKYNEFSYNSAIFESSLGVTGLGDIGVLTNIVENYSIAKNTSNAKEAKQQVFNCDIVVIDKETLEKYYFDKLNSFNSEELENKINTFSFNDKNSNVSINKVNYGLNSTFIDISYKNIKTKSGEFINGSFDFETFAPGQHHVSNVLATVTVALSLNLHEDIIKKGLANFKGIKGRTSLKVKDGFVIIEEINPGINTKAIESSIKMIKNLEDYTIILGGKYGVTCEEINEDKVAILLDEFIDKYNFIDNFKDSSIDNSKSSFKNNSVDSSKSSFKNNSVDSSKSSFKNNGLEKEKIFDLILTDDLGSSISKIMKNQVKYIKNPIEAQNLAISNNKNVLFIYRSNYSQINKR